MASNTESVGIKKKLFAVLILLRLYSLPGLFLLYYLAKVIITKNLGLDLKSAIMFLPVFFAWAYFTLLLEAKHKHKNREKIPYSYPIIALIITILLSIILAGVNFMAPLIFFLVFTYVYTTKNSVKIIGSISFVVRGLAEMSLFFFSAALFSTTYLRSSIITIGVVIFLIASARNLLGDVRDTKFDRITFSARFGDKSSYCVSILLYIASAFVLFNLTNESGVIAPITLIVIMLITVDNGYLLHRVSVLLSSIIMVAYILSISGNSNILLLLDVIFLGIVGNLLFYNLVPRKSNPKEGTPVIFGIVPWRLKGVKKTEKSKRL